MEEGTAVQNIYYEAHLHPEPGLPIIFRLDHARTDGEIGHLHWHEAQMCLRDRLWYYHQYGDSHNSCAGKREKQQKSEAL